MVSAFRQDLPYIHQPKKHFPFCVTVLLGPDFQYCLNDAILNFLTTLIF